MSFMTTEDRVLRLVGFSEGESGRSTGMSTPVFPVTSPRVSTLSVEDHVKALGAVCHVVEVQPGKSGWKYALVHSSPLGVAKISTDLGLEVFRSKKGDEYYVVVVSKPAVRPVPVAPVSESRPVSEGSCLRYDPEDYVVPAPEVVPRPRATVSPLPTDEEKGTVRLEIRGTEYIVRRTTTKRRIDVLRFEVRKDAGGVITEPYVVSFQDEAGHSGACSCKDWIYRRGLKGDCKHIHGVRNALVKPRQGTLPLTATG